MLKQTLFVFLCYVVLVSAQNATTGLPEAVTNSTTSTAHSPNITAAPTTEAHTVVTPTVANAITTQSPTNGTDDVASTVAPTEHPTTMVATSRPTAAHPSSQESSLSSTTSTNTTETPAQPTPTPADLTSSAVTSTATTTPFKIPTLATNVTTAPPSVGPPTPTPSYVTPTIPQTNSTNPSEPTVGPTPTASSATTVESSAAPPNPTPTLPQTIGPTPTTSSATTVESSATPSKLTTTLPETGATDIATKETVESTLATTSPPDEATTTLSPEVSKKVVEVILEGVKEDKFDEAKFKEAIAKYSEVFCQSKEDTCTKKNIKAEDVVIVSRNTSGDSLQLTFYIDGLTKAQLQTAVNDNTKNIKTDLGYQVQLKEGPPNPVPDWLIAVLAIVGFLLLMGITYGTCHVINKKRKKNQRKLYERDVSLHRDESAFAKDLEMQASGDVHQELDSQTAETSTQTKSEPSERSSLTKEDETVKPNGTNGISETDRRRLSSTAEYRNSVEKEFGDIAAKAEKDTQKLIKETEGAKPADQGHDNPAANVDDDGSTTRF